MGMESFTVPEDNPPERLDRFVTAQLQGISRGRVQRAISEGRVAINGKSAKASDSVLPGMQVDWDPPSAPPPLSAAPEDLPIDVLHEDEDLIVVNKAAGMVVHPGAGNPRGTLVAALLHHCQTLSSGGDAFRPGIVHRLDKETSGCLVAAKTDKAHLALGTQFAERRTSTTYLAIAVGSPRRAEGEISLPIERHRIHRKRMTVAAEGSGRTAITKYRVLAKTREYSLLRCELLTGRTHQIRVHLKALGHPLVGDEVYGRRLGFSRHLLHAWKLGFNHPTTGQSVQFTAPIPSDFAEIFPEEPRIQPVTLG